MISTSKSLLFSCCLLVAAPLWAQNEYDLPRLESLMLEGSRAVQAARDQEESARAGVRTASAFPNPELEYLAGSTRARTPAGTVGDARSLTLSQTLDLPWRRSARIGAAEAGLEAAGASTRAFVADQLARLRLRYYEVLRREAELKNAREDVALMESVRSRIELRVSTGDAPKFELIKAEAETLNAQKSAQAASYRVEQARAALRQATGEALPVSFVVQGSAMDLPELPPLERLREQLQGNNPELFRARSEAQRAEQRLNYEKAQRWPSLALKGGVDEDPDLRTSRFGVALRIPLWDRRQGPVGEAAADLARARTELDVQRFALGQSLEVAYKQYEIARSQVAALETGIVRSAEAALKVAEAAYRFGERGFIEVLDAQRVYRAARAELIAARYEVAVAWVEIERLRALPKDSKE